MQCGSVSNLSMTRIPRGHVDELLSVTLSLIEEGQDLFQTRHCICSGVVSHVFASRCSFHCSVYNKAMRASQYPDSFSRLCLHALESHAGVLCLTANTNAFPSSASRSSGLWANALLHQIMFLTLPR